MAANGGNNRQNNQMNEHVEFSVKAEEDLYLCGAENTIKRVTAETNYSCLMLKTQRFSSLFRHYAKYHGLRKDDLEYYFVNLLENEDTPESVQLQRGDTIMVRKKRKPEPLEQAADDDEFFHDMRDLLMDEEHMDAIFQIPQKTTAAAATSTGIKSLSSKRNSVAASQHNTSKADPIAMSDDDDLQEQQHAAKKKPAARGSNSSSPTPGSFGVTEIRAHKSVLTARAEYFKALFRSGGKSSTHQGFKESEECIIHVEPHFAEKHVRFVLEFLYTNRIQDLRQISTDDLLCLLHLSNKWLLRDLKKLVEHELIRGHMNVHTVARMYGATEEYHAQRLSQACIEFIMTNLRQLAGNTSFEEEMKNYPHLCIPVLKAAADLIPDHHHHHHHGPAHKKQRTDHGTPSSAVGGGSPVPEDT